MSKRNQTGFALIEILIVIAILIVVGLVAWQVYDNRQSSQQTEPKTNTTDKSQQDSQEATQNTDPNEGYVVIKEWGVRFKPVEGLKDVQYFKPKDVTSDAFSITTQQLSDLEPNCSMNSDTFPFGLLIRTKDMASTIGSVIATIDGYHYQYPSGHAACALNPDNFSIENRTRAQIRESVGSLEAAKE